MTTPGAATPTATVVEEFREAMSHWASGVAVVTTADDEPRGITVTSFTAVSLAPPMVLVCVDRTARCLPGFLRSDRLAVHVLSSGQRGLAERFAGAHADKFAGVRVRPGLGGTPLLSDVVAVLECEIHTRLDVGDHVVLVAQVRRAESADRQPLLYHRRGFR